MKKNGKRQIKPYRMTKKKAVAYALVAMAVASIGYFGWNSMIPANGSVPVFALREHHFIKAVYSNSGHHFVGSSSGSVKGLRSGGGSVIDPDYVLAKGDVQSLHFINEDKETHSRHNLNIDEFNVHTRDLGYFESQTVDFVPDISGTFQYYCTIHPEMKGQITVEG